MSVNWDIRDLLRILKTQTIPLVDVQINDVVVGDHGVEHVFRIERGDGWVGIFDKDANGCTHKIRYPGSKHDSTLEIIKRSSISARRLASVLENS